MLRLGLGLTMSEGVSSRLCATRLPCFFYGLLAHVRQAAVGRWIDFNGRLRLAAARTGGWSSRFVRSRIPSGWGNYDPTSSDCWWTYALFAFDRGNAQRKVDTYLLILPLSALLVVRSCTLLVSIQSSCFLIHYRAPPRRDISLFVLIVVIADAKHCH